MLVLRVRPRPEAFLNEERGFVKADNLAKVIKLRGPVTVGDFRRGREVPSSRMDSHCCALAVGGVQ